MENTIENKAKFFALYWGQDVMCFNDEGQYTPGKNYEVQGDFDDYNFLELKPLSEITDEDARGLFKDKGSIYNCQGINSVRFLPESNAFRVSFSASTMRSDINLIVTYLKTTETDFLRSKGYLIGWMDLTPEKILEYGWVKLIWQNLRCDKCGSSDTNTFGSWDAQVTVLCRACSEKKSLRKIQKGDNIKCLGQGYPHWKDEVFECSVVFGDGTIGIKNSIRVSEKDFIVV